MKSFQQFFESKSLEKYAKEYNVDLGQLRIGVEVEKEHDKGETDVVDGLEDLVKIAVAHLREDPKYYDKLEEIEDHD